MNILGISAFYHDSAAALVRDGKIIAAAQEERFTRKKHDANFPVQAVRYCLAEGGLAPDDLVWNPAMGQEWKPAATIPNLFATPAAGVPAVPLGPVPVPDAARRHRTRF